MKKSKLKVRSFFGWAVMGLILAGGGQVSAFSKKASAPKVESTPQSEALIWVSRADGSLQCEAGSGSKLETAREALEAAGVKVFEASRGHDGMMHIQMCGSPTGNHHMFKIRSSDLAQAKKLNFGVGLTDENRIQN